MNENENYEVEKEQPKDEQEQLKIEQEVQKNASAPKAPEKIKKPIYKKWWFWVVIGVLVISIIAGGTGSNSDTDDQGNGSVSGDLPNSQNQGNGSASGGSSNSSDNSNLGDFNVVIAGCRLAEDWEGAPVIIVKYKFTNNDDDPAAFWTSINDAVYQNNIGLNECYLVEDSANYTSDNQMKEIRKGATIEVEVAYELNDKTTPIVVEVEEFFSYDNKKVTKTFTIN